MKSVNLTNIVWKEGRHYVAQCLNVDVSSFGNTKKEALKNIQEAIALYFDNSNKPSFQKVLSPSLVKTSFKYA